MFIILNMGSVDARGSAGTQVPERDPRATWARILEAAIRRYAMDGLGAPLRAIAADAGVSPALILHHYGSRDGLRRACDEHVLATVARSKSELLTGSSASGAQLLVMMADSDDYAPAVGYVLRSLQAGGEEMVTLVDQLVAGTAAYLEEGVRAGTVRASRFPEARARWLTEMSLGSLVLQLARLGPTLDLSELPGWLRDYNERSIGPALELYTEPLLTDPQLLQSYLTTIRRNDP